MTQQQSKPNYIQRANKNGKKGIQRLLSSGDQGDCTTESHRSPTIVVHTMKPKSQNTSISEAEEESSERMVNEIEADQLSDIEFKTMIIRKLKEFSENYQKLQGSYKELMVNYTSMKKGRNNQQEPRGNEEYNF